MTREHLTRHPAPPPPAPAPPQPDEDAPRPRGRLRVWTPKTTSTAVVATILCTGLGAACTGIPGWVLSRIYAPLFYALVLLGALAGLAFGVVCAVAAAHGLLGKGVRVINRDLPRGARLARPALPAIDDSRIAA